MRQVRYTCRRCSLEAPDGQLCTLCFALFFGSLSPGEPLNRTPQEWAIRVSEWLWRVGTRNN